MDALIWDANPDAHRFAEAALQAILFAYSELEQHKGRDTVKTEGMRDPLSTTSRVHDVCLWALILETPRAKCLTEGRQNTYELEGNQY